MNILLLGLGYWGKTWYKNLLKGGYKFSVVETSRENGVDENNIQIFSELDEDKMVSSNFTHAIVATPACTHVELFKKLSTFLPKGNILIEKPCGTHYLDAHELEGCYPGYLQLHSPACQYIKQHLNDLGTVHLYKSVRASMGPRIRVDTTIVEDYLIHDLYLFVYLFQPFDNIQIESRNTMRRLSTTGTDTIFLNLYNPDVHVLGDMFSSWWYPIKERRVIIIGDQGSFIWVNDDLSFTTSRYEERNGQDLFGNWGDHLILNQEQKIDLGTKTSVECELENLLSGTLYGSTTYIQPVWNLIRDIHFHSKYRY